MDNISVRVGTLDDLDQVMRLAQMMHEEIGITSFNPSLVLPGIYSALQQERGLMGVIGPIGGELEGAVLLTIGKLFYSDDDVLEEKGVFIRPDLRMAKGGRAGKLCDFCKQAADALEMPLMIGIQNDVRTEGKRRLYERKFGAPVGFQFLYDPRKPHEEQQEQHEAA